MRVLLVSQYYAPEIGAPQARLSAMVRELVRRGHEVQVLTALPNYPTGRIFDDYRGKVVTSEARDGAEVVRVWVHAALGAGWHRLLNYLSFVVMPLVALRRIRRADLVLVESPPLFAMIPGLLLTRLRGGRAVMLIADLWPESAIELGLLREGRLANLLRRLERWSYRRCWRLSPVTEAQIEDLVGSKGVARERIVFLPNGVDTELYSPGPADDDVLRLLGGDDRWTVLYAGNHGYMHGLDVALDAAHLVREREPRVRFVFVGDGSDKARLQKRARDEGLDNVVFFDPRPPEDIARWYRTADAALVTLSTGELFRGARPAKTFPAMATGLPILFAGEGEGAELVERAGAGIVTPPGDPEALAAAVCRLARDPAAAAAMGERGRRLCEERFSWPALVEGWLAQLGSP
ncbi:MAG: glycosyltransferase WbuB [Actinomyces sp.]|nr:MAG: glycosyltransferase WbuB [Actinomyces sp.]